MIIKSNFLNLAHEVTYSKDGSDTMAYINICCVDDKDKLCRCYVSTLIDIIGNEVKVALSTGSCRIDPSYNDISDICNKLHCIKLTNNLEQDILEIKQYCKSHIETVKQLIQQCIEHNKYVVELENKCIETNLATR